MAGKRVIARITETKGKKGIGNIGPDTIGMRLIPFRKSDSDEKSDVNAKRVIDDSSSRNQGSHI
jgi:hypothetical protein